MERTPKLSRKLTLRSELLRNSSNDYGASESANAAPMPRSPSILSDDIGIECTPPHKKRTLDDSWTSSPKLFDCSFSPTAFSQTMALESPEVGWQWGDRKTQQRRDSEKSTATPDSAYAADSSFTSAESSSSHEVGRRGGALGRTLRPRLSYERRREEQRKALEVELRRTEKARAEEKLKRRCAKLQEQLKEAATQRDKQNVKETDKKRMQQEKPPMPKPTIDSGQTRVTPNATDAAVVENRALGGVTLGNDTLDDFLNDSDSDCLLLEATQQIESTLAEPSQKPAAAPATPKPAQCGAEIAALKTPTSSTKEKRSSLYMKFLEDDITDDWFLSLDEVILQATQTKKPRTSLQRYKSMPADTTLSEGTATTTTITPIMTRAMNLQCTKPQQDAATERDAKLKRHASTHSLSPASASYRGRQLRLRK